MPDGACNLTRGTTIDEGSGTADGTEPSSSTAADDAGSLSSGTVIDDGSGTAEGTKASSPVDDNTDLDSGTVIDDGSGAAEGTKPSWMADIGAGGNLSSGTVIEDGSGAAEGARSSSSEVEVAGSLCSGIVIGIVIDEGSGVAEGTELSSSNVDVAGNRCSRTFINDGSGAAERMKSPSPTDVEVAGGLDDIDCPSSHLCSGPRFSSPSSSSLSSFFLHALGLQRANFSWSFISYAVSMLRSATSCPLFIIGEIMSISDCRLFVKRWMETPRASRVSK